MSAREEFFFKPQVSVAVGNVGTPRATNKFSHREHYFRPCTSTVGRTPRSKLMLQAPSTGYGYDIAATLFIETNELYMKERLLSKRYQWTVGLIGRPFCIRPVLLQLMVTLGYRLCPYGGVGILEIPEWLLQVTHTEARQVEVGFEVRAVRRWKDFCA